MHLGRLKSNDAYYGDRMSAIMQKCQGKYGNWHLQVWRLGFILDLYTSLKKRNCNEGDMLGQMLVNVFLLIRELMALSIDLWNIQSHVHLYIKQVFDIYIYIYIYTQIYICKMLIIETKKRGITSIACYFLFRTSLNKQFHITDVYIFSTRQNNNWIYKNYMHTSLHTLES